VVSFVGPNYLVTLRPPEFKFAGEVLTECELKEEARKEYLSQVQAITLSDS